jgi:hypothetical protein
MALPKRKGKTVGLVYYIIYKIILQHELHKTHRNNSRKKENILKPTPGHIRIVVTKKKKVVHYYKLVSSVSGNTRFYLETFPCIRSGHPEWRGSSVNYPDIFRRLTDRTKSLQGKGEKRCQH